MAMSAAVRVGRAILARGVFLHTMVFKVQMLSGSAARRRLTHTRVAASLYRDRRQRNEGSKQQEQYGGAEFHKSWTKVKNVR